MGSRWRSITVWGLAQLVIGTAAPGAVRLFDREPDAPTAPTDEFLRLTARMTSQQVSFDNQERDRVLSGTTIGPIGLHTQPLRARAIVRAVASGTGPTSPPHLLALLPDDERITVVLIPLEPAASLSLVLLDLDVPAMLTVRRTSGARDEFLLQREPGPARWVGLIAEDDVITHVSVTPLAADGYGLDDVEIRHLIPEPATGLLVSFVGTVVIAIQRRRRCLRHAHERPAIGSQG